MREIHDFKLKDEEDEEESFRRSQEDRRQEMYRNYDMLNYGDGYQAGNNQCNHSGMEILTVGLWTLKYMLAGVHGRGIVLTEPSKLCINLKDNKQETVLVWTPIFILAGVRGRGIVLIEPGKLCINLKVKIEGNVKYTEEVIYPAEVISTFVKINIVTKV